ncbi:MAG: glycosyltransferase family 4 protein [Verrucomicrobia bacterium]|nr:glycosyltransferase family 4 protein [Verrucomicrobiota bacterium]MBI3867216.1 glycosyltransferase family 4 protein [Verrucomicrobiota bacterium]
MKLALIRRKFAATGGAELYLQRLIRALSEEGHEIHLFAEQWSDAPEGIVTHSVSVQAGRARRGLAFAEAVDEALRSHVFDCVFSLERTLRQDVYRAGDGVHRVWIQRRREFAPWWRRFFIGWSAFHRHMQALEARVFQPESTGRVIVNSEMVRQEILDHFAFPKDRIHLVRNGVDVDRLQTGRRAETRRRFGFKDEDLVLLFVGSGWERKGLRYAMKAVDHLGLRQSVQSIQSEFQSEEDPAPGRSRLHVKLLIVGKGRSPYLTSDDYVFAGSMSDVENAYAAADLFVVLPIYDPSANVVAEALAAGLPVITSAQNGASEWIEEGVNGTVLPDPSDIRAVSEAIADWSSRRFTARRTDLDVFRLERNVAETLQVLELAAFERA